MVLKEEQSLVRAVCTCTYEGKGFSNVVLKEEQSLIWAVCTWTYEGKGFSNVVLKKGWPLIRVMLYLRIFIHWMETNV